MPPKMKRRIYVTIWMLTYSVLVTMVSFATIVSIVKLRIGPVVWTVADSHGVHAGDVVIATIAGLLVTLFTIGLVLAVREMGGRERSQHL